MPTPPAEVRIDADLGRALLAEQHPDLADLPLALTANGWDNVTLRLGDGLALRLPRRRSAAQLIRHEQRWLPALATAVTLPVPVPVRTGRPGVGYPWAWSIVPWLPGRTADRSPPPPATATSMGRFLRHLHRAAPPDAPANPHRGVPLHVRDDTVGRLLPRLTREIDTGAARRLWDTAVSLPPAAANVWIHGDLHPRNVLVAEDGLAGIIDWGDLTAGDPATDLMCAWALYDDGARRRLVRAYGTDNAALWGRAQGWALLFGLILLDTGLTDDPAFAAVGRRILRRLLPDRRPPSPPA